MCGGFTEKLSPKNIKNLLPRNLKDVIVGPASSESVAVTKDALEGIGLKKPTKPWVDPEAERANAAAEAATQANARIAFMRKAQRENSLLTGGGAAAAGSGRSTLGV